jgi:hypothetical protein
MKESAGLNMEIYNKTSFVIFQSGVDKDSNFFLFLVQQLVGFSGGSPEVQTSSQGLGRYKHPVRLLARTGKNVFQ